MRLSVTELNDVTILRLPQEDLTLSIAENLVSKDVQAALPRFLNSLASEDTVRTWRFESQCGRVTSSTKTVDAGHWLMTLQTQIAFKLQSQGSL